MGAEVVSGGGGGGGGPAINQPPENTSIAVKAVVSILLFIPLILFVTNPVLVTKKATFCHTFDKILFTFF